MSTTINGVGNSGWRCKTYGQRADNILGSLYRAISDLPGSVEVVRWYAEKIQRECSLACFGVEEVKTEEGP